MASLTFFFDRNFGKRFPKCLSAIPGVPFAVEYHDDKKHGFSQTTQDEVWLAAIASQRWVVLSHDGLHKNAMAVAAIKQHKLMCFCLEGAQMPIWEKLTILARNYRGICETVSSVKPPYIFLVSAKGRIRRVAL